MDLSDLKFVKLDPPPPGTLLQVIVGKYDRAERLFRELLEMRSTIYETPALVREKEPGSASIEASIASILFIHEREARRAGRGV